MMAFTVRQPYGWAIIYGGKDRENRTQNIVGSYRGIVAIHAGKFYDPYDEAWDDPRIVEARWDWQDPYSDDDPPGWGVFGAVIGVAEIVGVHFESRAWIERYGPCSPWAVPDCWHIELANPVALPEPVPCRGQQGLWTLPPDVAQDVYIQLGIGPTDTRLPSWAMKR